MKSSRLLAILLLLQTRGRVTADELAREFEVSVRTVYRDIEALHAAGVPLYGDAGHHGGYRLLGGYRTRLTGLTEDEAQSLFLGGMPGPAAALGLGSALASSQLKLRAALPPDLRAEADRMRARFHLDAPGWYAEVDDLRHLPAVAEAVWTGRRLVVRYRRWKAPTEVDRTLDPYGLVLKAGRWYLVAGPGPRTFRVDQILEMRVSDDTFEIPDGFDLAEHWRLAQEDFHARLHQGEAVVRVAPGAFSRLTGAAARAFAETAVPERDGWSWAVLPTESLEHAIGVFLALGPDVEVLEPPQLRDGLYEAARTLADVYRPRSP
ncbi:YafY family transcriptional regulator [Streptomyces sp. NBC_00873]|uniref:helix-turn-helix transcriptional regulator n=1 Tax=Streptomyces sp. NBC_00873 TaxID=2975852 RepID=UPI00386305B3|nr:YafY family transcriptional regulator [Streptomyces sp. NBC_00873]